MKSYNERGSEKSIGPIHMNALQSKTVSAAKHYILPSRHTYKFHICVTVKCVELCGFLQTYMHAHCTSVYYGFNLMMCSSDWKHLCPRLLDLKSLTFG